MEICSNYKEGELIRIINYLCEGKILDKNPWYIIKVPHKEFLSNEIYAIHDYEDREKNPTVIGILNEPDIIWEKIDGPF